MTRTCKLFCALPSVLLALAGCDAKTATPNDAAAPPTAPAEVDGAPEGSAPAAPDDARGGRLFDNWAVELGDGFKAGESGGPRGDGSLLAADGSPSSAEGHSYRLKNYFGWDLRGAEGIYGPKYQNKSYVLERNLMRESMSEDEIVAWLSSGDTSIPAYAEVLDEAALRDTAAFIAKMQRGELPSAEMVWSLSETAPKNYTLNPGADIDAGVTLYADHCASCHGDDGTGIAIHETMSVGFFGRTKGYESWIKMVSGHPGTPMERELSFDDAADGGAQILNISAALCDRTRFPSLAGQPDVADGDARCGAYLK